MYVGSLRYDSDSNRYQGKDMRVAMFISSAVFCSLASAAAPKDINQIKMQRLAQEQVRANLKDGGSALFRNQRGFCGEVNSKNAFGGYVGYQRFIAAGEKMVVFERDPALAAGAFDGAWRQFCK
ncbi:hypothetical protein CAL18_12545 [Bordetella genomosp. 7]|nr:hypothetical protein CAL18_12545 [Bordetella genomosp. 7]